MLIAPSWGGMINGLLTLRGAWNKLRTDAVLKFFVAAITFYGMATFEGPLMSIKAVNRLSHFTDWTIAHVHGGGLGWNGFMAFGLVYFLVPKLWHRPVWSQRLMNLHFWLSTVGIVLYVTSMWTAGITQGLMWRAVSSEGLLKYPDFVETVTKLMPFYWGRAVGGLMYLLGAIIMAYNVLKTIRVAKAEGVSLADAQGVYAPHVTNAPEGKPAPSSWHHLLEAKAVTFSALVLVAVLVGGLFEIIPMITVSSNVPAIATVHPYTPLELEGRDIFVREGCYTCHSQMVRPLPEDILRYGVASQSGEFVYDHPFQFGSKRTGPDLARVGGKYPNLWHYNHMIDPRATSPGSIMPTYQWLRDSKLDTSLTTTKISVMRKLGVPYSESEQVDATKNLASQAQSIADDLKANGVAAPELEKTEIVALIAYLQRLGKDIKQSTGN
jgi:cytochrome c oxidase cbb3-type subunit I/II